MKFAISILAALSLFVMACSGGDEGNAATDGDSSDNGSTQATEAPTIEIVELTNPATPGATIDLQVQASPNAECDVAVRTPFGTPVTAEGIGPATADASGLATWTWVMPDNSIAGSFNVAVECGGARVEQLLKLTTS